MTVGKKIRAIRKSLKQTQKQLAKASGIGLNSIIRYEKGLRDPTISQLQRIAQGLGVPIVELLPEDVECCEAPESNLGKRFHANIMKRFLDIK